MQRFLQELKSFPKKGDWVLLLLCLVTSAFGCVVVASATSAPKFGDSSMRYIIIQLAATFLGVVMYAVISSIDIESMSERRNLLVIFNVFLMLLLLAESVASRMRDLVSRCTVIEVYVRDVNLNSFTRRKTLRAPTCSSLEIAKVAFGMFCNSYRWDVPIRSVGVRGAGLVTADSYLQLSLFEEDIRRDRGEQLDAAIDKIRARYGYMSVRRALTLTDPVLGRINPKDDHTVHPVGYFGR